MRVVVVLLVCLAVVQAGTERNKRRRIKKKVLVNDEEKMDVDEGEVVVDEQQQIQPKKDKSGRGFLDDYYSKFESRTDKVETRRAQNNLLLPANTKDIVRPAQQVLLPWVDNSQGPPVPGAPGVPEDLAVYSQQEPQQRTEQATLETRQQIKVLSGPENYPGYENTVPLQAERRSDTEVKLDQLKEQEQQLLNLLSRENELSIGEKEQLLHQLELWEKHRRLLEQEREIEAQEAQERNKKSSPLVPSSPLHSLLPSNPFTNYVAEVIPTSLAGPAAQSDFDNQLYTDTRSSYDGSSTTSGVTKYLGLTGTTSRDIQLGLTFTVPFLSIPLANIDNILGGNFGDIGSLLNFGNIDTGTIVTFIVIAGASIFILPQAIYWLTGINLSSFNWGRSDDDAGGLVALANTVDMALQEFSIDGRGCVARVLCSTLHEDGEEKGYLVKTIAKSAISNASVKAFLGEDTAEALGRDGNTAQCTSRFRATCPWDPSAVTSIIMKLMESQGTSLAEVALKAMTAAAS